MCQYPCTVPYRWYYDFDKDLGVTTTFCFAHQLEIHHAVKVEWQQKKLTLHYNNVVHLDTSVIHLVMYFSNLHQCFSLCELIQFLECFLDLLFSK